MSYVFTASTPTKGQIEKLRLTLSTYQDGTGYLVSKLGKSLPGWRDFERSVALVFDGVAQESKAIFDVLVPISLTPITDFGVSCKMRETLRTVENKGLVLIEVSNSERKFWNALNANGIYDYNTNLDRAGKVLLNLVESWHDKVSLEQGGTVDISKSYYLVLQWDKRSGRYQLFQFPTHLPDPEVLSWEVRGKRIVGHNDDVVIIEWYGHSGGQLKYYPSVDEAIWSSDIFRLEPLPENDLGNVLKQRVIGYFPDLWRAANEM